MSSWWQDLRFGARVLARKPALALMTILVLALGIGANSTLFSLVNAFLLRPLPYAEPSRLMHLFQVTAQGGFDQARLSLPQYLDWQDASQAFEDLAVYNYGAYNLSDPGSEPEQMLTGRLSANLLPMLGVRPLRGRVFAVGEDAPGAEKVAILGESLWRRRYGGRELVGESIQLDGESYTVVGILPRDVLFPYPEVKMWVPLTLDAEGARRDAHAYLVVGRLADGIEARQATTELATIHRRLAEAHPETDGRFSGPRIVPLRQALLFSYKEIRLLLMLMMGAGLVILMIVTANVANLLLARAGDRAQEVAIRTSLGASRGRLVQQLLSETFLLACGGGLLGLFLARQGTVLLGGAMPEALFRVGEIEVDRLSLVFTAGVALLATVLAGLTPALRSSVVDLTQALKQGGRGGLGAGSRLRGVLVAAQLALAVVLLSGAFWMLRSAEAMKRVDLGFDPENTLTMQLVLPSAQYSESAQWAAFYADLEQRLEALPGVEAASAVRPLPQNFATHGIEFEIPGRQPASSDERLGAHRIISTPHYFKAQGIPLRAGRAFDAGDRKESAPVVVVNRAFVERFGEGGSMVGSTLRLLLSSDQQKEATVVGVVDDIRDAIAWQGATLEPQIYLPLAQFPLRSAYLVVRTAGDPLSSLALVREALKRADPNLPVSEVRSMEQVLSTSVAPLEIASRLLGVFAAVALLLSALGLYGVVAFTVSRRTHEFGIRMALGAGRRSILSLVLREGAVMAAVGVGVGLVLAVGLSRVVSSQLAGVESVAISTLLLVALALAATTLGAGLLPARRAAGLDPVVALRDE